MNSRGSCWLRSVCETSFGALLGTAVVVVVVVVVDVLDVALARLVVGIDVVDVVGLALGVAMDVFATTRWLSWPTLLTARVSFATGGSLWLADDDKSDAVLL